MRSFVLLLFVACAFLGCATGDSSDGRKVSLPGHPSKATRLLLVSAETSDSARVAEPVVVDGMLAQAFDDIPEATYVTLEEQQAVQAKAGDSAVAVATLASELNANGLIALRIARFGSVVGVDMRVFDPVSGEAIFQDRAFSFIRYRTDEDVKLFGPALYEALQRLVYRMNKRPDTEQLVVAAQPIVVSNVVIERDQKLGKISSGREAISTDGVRALGDFMRAKYPEFVVFDYESRGRVYETVGVKLVEDHAAVSGLERSAMFGLDLPYYLTTGIYPAPNDSVDIRAEIRYVVSANSDTVVHAASKRFLRTSLETSTMVKDVVTQVLEVADDVLEHEADRILKEYAQSIGEEK